MKQPVKSSLLVLAGIAVGIGLAIVIPAGYSLLSDLSNSASTESATSSTESATPFKSEERSFESLDSSQVSDPKVIADLNSSFARKTALFALLADVDVEELLEILKISNEISPASRREEIQSAVLQKLALIDPEVAFREVQKKPRLEQDPLLHSLFEEWSSTSLEHALAQAESLRGSQRETALRAILHSRDDLTEGERLQLAKQLGNEDLAKTLIANEKILEHTGSPSEKWKYIVNDGVDDEDQIELLLQVAELWFDEIGLEVLSRIHEEYRGNDTMYSTLVRSLTKHDPHAAIDFLLGVDGEQQESVGEVVMTSWARTDPVEALNALEVIEDTKLRNSLVNDLAWEWATRDPSVFLQNANLIEPAVPRLRALLGALGEIAKSSPREALRQVEMFADSNVDTSTLVRSITYTWSEKDPQATVDWILSNYGSEDPQRANLLQRALSQLSLENPHKAMEIALEQPVLENQPPPEYQIIAEMSYEEDLENTVELLSRVRPHPTNESRGYAYGLVGKAFIRNEQPNEALNLALKLPPTQREEYYRSFSYDWAYTNPLQLYEQLEDLSDDNAKSVFASALVDAQELRPLLTDQQLDQLREYVQEESE